MIYGKKRKKGVSGPWLKPFRIKFSDQKVCRKKIEGNNKIKNH